MAGAQSYIQIGKDFLRQENYLEAIKYLKEASNILPSSDAAHCYLTEAYLAFGGI